METKVDSRVVTMAPKVTLVVIRAHPIVEIKVAISPVVAMVAKGMPMATREETLVGTKVAITATKAVGLVTKGVTSSRVVAMEVTKEGALVG